ncbi:PaaI family thioesterase [Aeromicrobium terrae]|uniref:PaaI family thioesterase n=1 Tax=Aeromicrobium terrae TaxID=2498846 RepID=UPI001E54ABC4|nr:PaaI family thioesterase [Aeromicrobium terrae]
MPLAASVRELIDATLLTEVDESDLLAAQQQVDAATALLRGRQRDRPLGVGLDPDGEPLSWGNVAIGTRNPVAPPLDVVEDAPGRAHLDVELGAAYEGAPDHVHGGYSALVLDHLLGVVASFGRLETAAATGTISLRYQRPTRLGHLHAEAEVERTDGRKIFVVGHIADDEGVTITAEGVYFARRT